jgi:hypothetical protein
MVCRRSCNFDNKINNICIEYITFFIEVEVKWPKGNIYCSVLYFSIYCFLSGAEHYRARLCSGEKLFNEVTLYIEQSIKQKQGQRVALYRTMIEP